MKLNFSYKNAILEIFEIYISPLLSNINLKITLKLKNYEKPFH